MVGEHRWDDRQAEVCIGDRFCYGVAVGEAALTVLHTKEIRGVSEDEAGEARQGADAGGVHSEAPLTDADDVPVTVSFDLGQIDVPLGELRRIDEGYSFNLQKPLDGAVTMRINGRLIGKGELVEIEGSLGVRVVELFAKRHG
jgi:type III secretion system YscQ/HrcQ family protein